MTTTATATQGSGPKVGERAPDFTVKTIDGGSFHLADALQRDHVVIAFFPAAFSSVCTKEICSFTERLNDLRTRHATVIAVSGDQHFAQKAWAEKNGITVAVGSDYNHDVARAYGVAYPLWKDYYRGAAKRSVFVVDKGGVVRFRWVTEDAGVEPAYDEVVKAVGALR